MKAGDRVRIKKLAEHAEKDFLGKTGDVINDSKSGEVVTVQMDNGDKSTARQFLAGDLELVGARNSA